MATEAAWLKCKKTLQQGGKRKTDLTLTGLLMEGLHGVLQRAEHHAGNRMSENWESSELDALSVVHGRALNFLALSSRGSH
jgi:hypothetical protein